MQGKKDYQEKLFIRFQLSDYVPEDNFYRQLKSLLDFSFLYSTTSKYYGKEGQKSIDPIVFMKLMLVGYLENLNSDRRIISTSRMRMDILYFIGYDLDEELPWHSTLSRTRQLYGEEEFTIIFRKVLKMCIDKGLVSGKRQAIDSVFVKANAGASSLIEREIMDDVAVYSKELAAHEEKQSPSAIIKFRAQNKSGHPSDNHPKKVNQKLTSLSDPDARLSYKPGKVTRLNYLSQVSVDTASHIITHIQAFHADKRDGQCLPEILEHTVKNLKENGLEIKEVIADTGYSNESALLALDQHNIEAYIPNNGRYKDERKDFSYDLENDRYICSHGKHLTFRHYRDKGTSTHKVYKTNKKDCINCPLKDSCADRNLGVKVLRDSSIKQLYAQMQQRVKSRKGKQMKKLRSSTVEPVIGTLINFTAMRQVNTKGIQLANKCMIMAAVAYNLKKIIKNISIKNRKVALITLQNGEKTTRILSRWMETLILSILGMDYITIKENG